MENGQRSDASNATKLAVKNVLRRATPIEVVAKKTGNDSSVEIDSTSTSAAAQSGTKLSDAMGLIYCRNRSRAVRRPVNIQLTGERCCYSPARLRRTVHRPRTAG